MEKKETEQKPTEQKEEQKKPEMGDEDLELFSNYIQCFKNQGPENLKFNKKFNELMKERKFWDTQPVPKPTDVKNDNFGPLEKKKVEDISEARTKLPKGFEWSCFDIEKEKDMDEIYTLLYENYVEDDDGYFRFDYSREFLRWALFPPKSSKELHFGIRDCSKGNKLVGFITGIVLEINVEGKIIHCTEVNFLCVHKDYRNHYIASVLIREVVRISNRMNIWQGLYTSGTMLPTPIAQTRYYHRSLNPKKLIDVKFSYKPSNQKMSTHLKLHSLPDEPSIPNGFKLRKAEAKDSKQIRTLLMDYLTKYSIYTEYSKKDVAHWFTCRDGIIESYVIEKNNKISDFFSFYNLPSSVLNHDKYKQIKAAYSYYFVNTTMDLRDLYMIALITAKNLGYDVFNVLDIMDNQNVFEDLRFSAGDGYLQYYLYNWQLKKKILHPNEIGIVLM